MQLFTLNLLCAVRNCMGYAYTSLSTHALARFAMKPISFNLEGKIWSVQDLCGEVQFIKITLFLLLDRVLRALRSCSFQFRLHE